MFSFYMLLFFLIKVINCNYNMSIKSIFSHTKNTAKIKFYLTFLLILFMANSMPGFAAEKPLYLAKVSVDEAVRKVNKNQKSRVLGAKTKIIEGRKVHVIKTLSNKGRIKNRRVDAETGKPLNNRR